jgi:hypothetical protein
MSNKIKQALRDHDLRGKILSDDKRRFIGHAQRTLDSQGKPIPLAYKAIKTPLVMNWLVSETEYIRAARAGTAVLFSCYSITPPSSGQLILRLYQTTEGSGETIISTLYCPQSTRIFEQVISVPVLAGAWLSVDVQATGSASGVSASLTINVG